MSEQEDHPMTDAPGEQTEEQPVDDFIEHVSDEELLRMVGEALAQMSDDVEMGATEPMHGGEPVTTSWQPANQTPAPPMPLSFMETELPPFVPPSHLPGSFNFPAAAPQATSSSPLASHPSPLPPPPPPPSQQAAPPSPLPQHHQPAQDTSFLAEPTSHSAPPPPALAADTQQTFQFTFEAPTSAGEGIFRPLSTAAAVTGAAQATDVAGCSQGALQTSVQPAPASSLSSAQPSAKPRQIFPKKSKQRATGAMDLAVPEASDSFYPQYVALMEEISKRDEQIQVARATVEHMKAQLNDKIKEVDLAHEATHTSGEKLGELEKQVAALISQNESMDQYAQKADEAHASLREKYEEAVKSAESASTETKNLKRAIEAREVRIGQLVSREEELQNEAASHESLRQEAKARLQETEQLKAQVQELEAEREELEAHCSRIQSEVDHIEGLHSNAVSLADEQTKRAEELEGQLNEIATTTLPRPAADAAELRGTDNLESELEGIEFDGLQAPALGDEDQITDLQNQLASAKADAEEHEARVKQVNRVVEQRDLRVQELSRLIEEQEATISRADARSHMSEQSAKMLAEQIKKLEQDQKALKAENERLVVEKDQAMAAAELSAAHGRMAAAEQLKAASLVEEVQEAELQGRGSWTTSLLILVIIFLLGLLVTVVGSDLGDAPGAGLAPQAVYGFEGRLSPFVRLIGNGLASGIESSVAGLLGFENRMLG